MTDRYLKQVIVVRKDLSMPQGKLAAMVAHASMTFIVKRLENRYSPDEAGLTEGRGFFTEDEWRWLTELDPGIEEMGQVSMAKIVCAVDSFEELDVVRLAAEAAGLNVDVVVDSGYSHNPKGTVPAIAVGPAWPERLDPVTGHLRVYR